MASKGEAQKQYDRYKARQKELVQKQRREAVRKAQSEKAARSRRGWSWS